MRYSFIIQPLPYRDPDRIVISPYAAKRLSMLLGGVVKEYETRFGTLNIEPGIADTK